MNAYSYRFEPVTLCNMCGSADAKVLGRRLNGHQGLRARHSVGIATTVVQCRECRLIYANPRPVPESLAHHYDRAPEDYWLDAYFRHDPEYFREQVGTFRRLWRGAGKPRALDIGAGLGKTLTALAQDGFDAYGLEPSPSFRDRALAGGVEAERLQLASLENAAYESGEFDFISFGAVLEHLHEPAAAIERALTWAAEGGLVHIEVPSATWLLSRLLNLVYRVEGVDYVTNLSPMHPPYHLYEFTLRSFELHALRSSYEVVAHCLHVGDTFLPRRLQSIATRVMAATGTGMQLEVWLRR
jgi:SAM-dependent methyltransferase